MGAMAHSDHGLPAGLTRRPLQLSDAAAVTALMAAEQQASTGRVSIEEADIVSDWRRPSFDITARTVGVFDGDRLVGYAEVGRQGRADAAVALDHHGRGIGSWLARWIQERGRALGHRVVGMPVPAGSPAEKLLRALGYQVRWHSWVLLLPEGHTIEDGPLPDGYRIRVAESEDDRRAAWEVIEDAFLEWSAREKEPYDDWVSGVTGRPGFEPWNLRVVVDPREEVVGGVFVVLSESDGAPSGFVDKLAVRKDQRGRGLARALLAGAFRTAREHGAARSELSTDSRTGALDLYRGLGMEIREDWVNLGTHV
jgi:GNAT superfamily N-acetyltransferase